MNGPSLPDSSLWPTLGTPSRNTYRVSDEVVDMRRPAFQPRAVQLRALPQQVVFEVEKAALVVIDMQNDFCAGDGWIASMGVDVSPAQALAQPINAAAAALRAVGAPVVWLNWGVRPDRLNLSPGTQHPFNPNGRAPGLGGRLSAGPRSHNVLQQDSWGSQVIDALVQAPSDINVSKHRISGFWDTPLDSILKNLDVTTLFFAGVNTDHCVLGTLMDANFHGYDTLLLEDCTGTTSPDFCLQATLHNVRFCFGFTTTSKELTESLAPLAEASHAAIGTAA